eukprot:4075166-Pyramimonas_sp.AAC.1
MFGASAANAAWHRLGSFIRHVVLVKFRAPLFRYVDDFFGVSRRGVGITGGWLVTEGLPLLGLVTDPAKDVDDTLVLPVLGAVVE